MANKPSPATLDILSFGSRLIRTEDLDPAYCLLYRSGWGGNVRRRWLLAYWCFYHVGVACKAAGHQGGAFYEVLRQAQRERWPRGTERRHFRGEMAARSVAELERLFPVPEEACRSLEDAGTFGEVSRRVRGWYGFGPWIVFKVADMLERCLGVPVDFADCELGFYKEPAAAAKMMDPIASLGDVVQTLLEGLGRPPAPPALDRPCGVQEAETVLCKWKSHYKGHYPPGKDTAELRHVLRQRCWGPLGLELLTLPPVGRP